MWLLWTYLASLVVIAVGAIALNFHWKWVSQKSFKDDRYADLLVVMLLFCWIFWPTVVLGWLIVLILTNGFDLAVNVLVPKDNEEK